MMFCFNCGKELPNEAKFCAYCGTNLSKMSIEVDDVSDKTTVGEIYVREDINVDQMQKQELALIEARGKYKLGIGAFERRQYDKAEVYFVEALEKGMLEAAYVLAETYYRNDRFNTYDDKNKLEYVGYNGDNIVTYLRREEYVIRYLLQAAIMDDNRAVAEFCGWVVLKFADSKIKDLFRYGLLDDLKEGFVIKGVDFEVEEEIYDSGWCEYTIKELRDWSYANLLELAQIGVGAAQFYVGVYYAKQYDLSCSSEDKAKARYWLGQACGKVNAPNVYKINEYLNKFIAFGDCPENDFFV